MRSTDFTYSDEADPDRRAQSRLTPSCVARHPDRLQARQRRLPQAKPAAGRVRVHRSPIVQDAVEEVDPESLENLPIGLDGGTLPVGRSDGEGLSGILTEQAGAWFYKRNLSPITSSRRTAASRRRPLCARRTRRAQAQRSRLSGGRQQFMDLAGDGQPDLVVLDGPTPGFYEHDDDEGWEPFRPFTSLPEPRHARPQPEVRRSRRRRPRRHADHRRRRLRLASLAGRRGFGPARRVRAGARRRERPAPRLRRRHAVHLPRRHVAATA